MVDFPGIYRHGVQPGAVLQPPSRLRPQVQADGLREGARPGKINGILAIIISRALLPLFFFSSFRPRYIILFYISSPSTEAAAAAATLSSPFCWKQMGLRKQACLPGSACLAGCLPACRLA